MYNLEYAIWDFYPKNLSPIEVDDPVLVIKDFLSADDIPGHRKTLLEWRNCVLEDRYYIDEKGNPSAVLFTHQLHIKLIEAAYLFRQVSWSKLMMVVATHYVDQLKYEAKNWTWFPDNLSERELFNPYFVIRDFFKVYSLPEYREQLYEWLATALSTYGAQENLQAADIISVYENLQKLQSVVWLIHQRLTLKPYNSAEEL